MAPYAKSLQSCPTLCNPIDGSPPGFPVPGILQARPLEWVAISFSNAFAKYPFGPRSQASLQKAQGPQVSALLGDTRAGQPVSQKEAGSLE